MIKVLLFASIAEKVQRAELILPEEQLTVAQVIAWIGREYPDVKEELKQVMVAVNEEFARPEQRVGRQDVVAILPPVSGG